MSPDLFNSRLINVRRISMTSIVLTPAQVQKVLTENQSAPTDPVLPPDPIAPPPTPLPPVEPPVANMDNRTIRGIFGRELRYPTNKRGADSLTTTDVVVSSAHGVSIAMVIPAHPKTIGISVAKASSRTGPWEIIDANLSLQRGFGKSLDTVSWGSGHLAIERPPSDKDEIIYLNAKQRNGTSNTWGLHIQPALRIKK